MVEKKKKKDAFEKDTKKVVKEAKNFIKDVWKF